MREFRRTVLNLLGWGSLLVGLLLAIALLMGDWMVWTDPATRPAYALIIVVGAVSSWAVMTGLAAALQELEA